ncbi:MAG: hypothetical protein JOZ70_06950 [Pseudolabrys sp.]|nr:hypothetical protein [Pseudolabrys sp.]MBV9954972.1 hypothetical protein [Pseudolabrys sp.]
MKHRPRASDWDATYPVQPWKWFGTILAGVVLALVAMGLVGFLTNGT